MARKTKAQIEFSVAAEGFKTGIKQMNSSLSTVNKELRLNAEQMKGASDASGLLQDRQQFLKNGLAASREKIVLINKELAEAEQLLGKNSKEYHTLSNSLISAKVEQQKMVNALQKVNEEIAENSRKAQEQERENRSLSQSFKSLQNEVEQQKTKLQGLKEDYQGLLLKTSKNSKEAKNLEKEIQELSKSLNKNESEIKRVENAANGLSGEFNEAEEAALGFGDVLKANVLGGVVLEGIEGIASGLKDIGGNLVTMGIDSQKSLNTFAAKTGAAGKELDGMDEAIKDIYRNNFGESLEGIAGNMATVQHITGQTGEELKKSTQNAQSLSDTFDMDMSESVRGVQGLIYQFGLDSTQAFDLMAAGAQNGLDYTGELGDNIAEYGGKFQQAGYTAQEYFQLLENGSSNGAYNLDKVNDAINEVTNRLADGTLEGSMDSINQKTGELEEGTGNWGKGVEDLFKQWQQGGATQKQVIDAIVEDIKNTENQQDKLNKAALAFGTMGEDGNMKFIESLTSVGKTFEDTKGTMEELNKVKYDDLGSAVEGIKRNIEMDVLEPIEDRLFPALSDLAANTDFSKFGDAAVQGIEGILDAIEFVAENKNVFTPIAAGVGGLAGVAVTASVGMGIYHGVLDIIALKTGAATVATTGLGAAFTFLTSPMTLVVLAIGAVIGIGVALYQNWDTIKEKAGQLKDAAVEKVTALKDGAIQKFTEAKDKVVETAENLKTAAVEKIEGLKTSAVEKFESLKTSASEKWTSMKTSVVNKAQEIWVDATSKLEGLRASGAEKFEGMRATASEKWTNMKTDVANKAQEMWNSASSKFEGIRTSASEKFSGAKDLMTNLMEEAKANVFTKLQNMKNSYDEAGGGIKGIVSATMTGVKDHFSTYMSLANSITGGKLDSIKEAFSSKMNAARDIVRNSIDRIKGFFDFDWSLPDIKLPHFSFTGKFSLNPPSVPHFSVKWYAKGGLFTGPTIMPANGFGEAGHEYALPLNRTTLRPLAEMIGGMITQEEMMQPIDYKMIDKIIGKHSKKEYVCQISKRELMRILEA